MTDFCCYEQSVVETAFVGRLGPYGIFLSRWAPGIRSERVFTRFGLRYLSVDVGSWSFEVVHGGRRP